MLYTVQRSLSKVEWNIVSFPRRADNTNSAIEETSNLAHTILWEAIIPNSKNHSESDTYKTYEEFIWRIFWDLFIQKVKIQGCSKDYISFSVWEKRFIVEWLIILWADTFELAEKTKKLIQDSEIDFFDVEVISISKIRNELTVSFRDDTLLSVALEENSK